MRHLPYSRILFFLLALFCRSASAEFVVLFDGNGLPANQNWLSFASNGVFTGGTATQTPVATGVRLQTDGAVSAGYGSYTPFSQLNNAAFPSLNRTSGFELNFSLALASEGHANNNRAGFSVTLLGSDARGIELGFWDTRIWAQEVGFTQSEAVNIVTTVPRDYRLRIENDTYSLFSGANQLLSGGVRNYAAFGLPYSLPNMLFLGDNTSSGAADVTLGAITLQSNLAAVPEPTSVLTLVVTVVLFFGLNRKRRLRLHSRNRWLFA